MAGKVEPAAPVVKRFAFGHPPRNHLAMPIRLTLTRDGKVLVERTIKPVSLESQAGEIGQAAHRMYAAARQLGHDVVGTTLEIAEVPDRSSDLLAKAEEAVRRRTARDPRS